MSWYSTKEEAARVCEWKARVYGERFMVLPESTRLGKDTFETTIYWAQRVSSLKKELVNELEAMDVTSIGVPKR